MKLNEKKCIILKRKNKCIAVIAILILFLVFENVSVDAISNDIKYRIHKSRFIAEIGDNTARTKDFWLNEITYPEKKIVTASIEIDNIGVTGNLFINENSEYFAWPTSMLKLRLPNHFEQVPITAYRLLRNWELNKKIEQGYNLYIYPYIIPSFETWNYFETIGDTFESEYEDYKNQGHAVNCQFVYTDEQGIVTFEIWCGGVLSGLYSDIFESAYDIPANILFDNLFKIVIEKSSGIITGLGIKGRTEGYLNQTKVKVKYDYYCGIEDYKVQEFTIGPKFYVLPYLIRDLKIILPILSMFMIVCIIVFILRKRLKNKEKVMLVIYNKNHNE